MSDHTDLMPQPDVSHIVLVGLMGAGKTTVGQILAADIGWRFVDTDTQIQAETGHTIRELWQEGGEAAYRPLEADAVLDALRATEPSVLAAPGGVVDDERASQGLSIADVAVVYLRANADTLSERVGRDPGHRPLIDDQPEELMAQQFAQRDTNYERLADVVIDVDDLNPDEVANSVREELVGIAFRPDSIASEPDNPPK